MRTPRTGAFPLALLVGVTTGALLSQLLPAPEEIGGPSVALPAASDRPVAGLVPVPVPTAPATVPGPAESAGPGGPAGAEAPEGSASGPTAPPTAPDGAAGPDASSPVAPTAPAVPVAPVAPGSPARPPALGLVAAEVPAGSPG
ncbi:hypothetical protein ACFC0A_37675, partial [Kitasatospora purpeofusca]